jgi:FixJ family two-component response regulator
MKDMLIVAVDDEAEILDLYKSSLRTRSRIETFTDPTAFIDQLKRKQIKPDILIADYSMPGMNGIEMIRIAKHLGHEIHAILISGYIDKGTAIAAANLGNTIVLEKPAPGQKILSAVDAYILELEFKRIKSSSDMTYKRMRELFDIFRTFCLDELELKSTSAAQVVPTYKKEKAESLDHAIYKLENELEDLSVAEKEIFKKIVKLKTNLIAA